MTATHTPERAPGPGSVKAMSVATGTLSWDPVARVPAAEDRLVTAAFRSLTAEGIGLTPDRARELGRLMGCQAGAGELRAFVDAFSHLGLGTLRLAADELDRAVFDSPDLRGAERAGASCCTFALGFCEGATQATRGGTMLGAEVRCRSRGAPACTFVVMRKR